tara:strand:- start:270 stop:563 length:294 start_codon:yes stop_codon:yes gene_type:complete
MKQMPEGCLCCSQAIDCSAIDRMLVKQGATDSNMGHLKEINKGYFSHLFGAWKMAGFFALGAIRCIIHGVIPDLDTTCAQDTAKRVNMNIPVKDPTP